MLKCYGHEKLTANATAAELTDAEFNTSYAKEVLITVEDASIRVTFDGTTPVPASKIGHVIPQNASVIVTGRDIASFKYIRETGSDAVLNVSYFNEG